jgi:pimeloyl-ACP methyl ester carboxylesterase
MMQNTTSYFLHGLDSSGKGTKGRFFTEHFPQVVCPDFVGTLAKRLNLLDELCKNQQRLILIGSSFGGLMATHYATKHPEKIIRLVLLAPALNFEGYQPPVEQLQIPTLLIVGKHDTVTPAAIVTPLAKATFSDLQIRIEDDDHLLHKSFTALNWPDLLKS